MTTNSIRIGTRRSKLARWQASRVARELTRQEPGLNVTLVEIETAGDLTQQEDWQMPTTPGFFVKELEKALLEGVIDAAAHSLKDLPSTLPPGCTIAAYMAREDATDRICCRDSGTAAQTLAAIVNRDTAWCRRVGTASPRRTSMLRHHLPAADLKPIRGNVETRLKKLESGQFDVVVLATAGLRRLDIPLEASLPLPLETFVPAPGQGVVAVECLEDRSDVQLRLAKLNHPASGVCARAERAFMARLGASCLTPVGVYAELRSAEKDAALTLRAMLFASTGDRCLRHETVGSADKPEAAGVGLAEHLFRQGAADLLAGDKCI